MEKLKRILMGKYEIILPILHFILTFAWRRKIFLGFGNWEYFNTIVKNKGVISAAGEQYIVYLLSSVFCFLIIFAFWKLIFFIVKGRVDRRDVIILGVIFGIGLFCGFILYPSNFGLEIDNYTNYLMARRFQPTYWQSIYTGALYGGCLMVIPHPIALFVVQWGFFWSVVSYIYLGIKKVSGDKSIQYISLLLFLLPESYFLTFNTYRNNYYAVLILLYISYIYFSIKDNARAIGVKKKFLFLLCTAFIMVWRSEGLLVGVGGILIYLFFIIKIQNNIKTVLSLICSLFVMFVILSQIQAIGSKKYYGRDYMILNTTSVLYNIFNNPNSYLSYKGAQEDLKAIGAVIPVQVLKEKGMDGYRSYNWTNGRKDFNQTLTTDEKSKDYMSAYYRIILNNLKTYLDVQMNAFYFALQLPTVHTQYSYSGDSLVELENYVYDTWKEGEKEVKSVGNTKFWEKDKTRIGISAVVNEIISGWRELILNSGINVILHSLSLIGLVLVLIKEILYIIDRKKSLVRGLPFIIAFVTVLGEYIAIMLFMPEGRATYLYPMLYASYLILYLYFSETLV